MTENTLKKIYNITQACVTAIKHSLILISLIITTILGILLFPLPEGVMNGLQSILDFIVRAGIIASFLLLTVLSISFLTLLICYVIVSRNRTDE